MMKLYKFGPKKIVFLLFLSVSFFPALAWATFDVIALGVYGGVKSDNLTSYLIKSDEQDLYLALDAGTTVTGVERAIKKGSFPELKSIDKQKNNNQGYVLRNLIDSYWISHGHLDHVAGLIISSPDDTHKNIYGSEVTLSYISTNIFNWITWPNMTDTGRPPRLGKLIFKPKPMDTPFTVGKTGLIGRMYPLNHGGYLSSMLLVSYKSDCFAFFGDTGTDFVQKSNELKGIWKLLSMKVRSNSLKGIIIETSYDNSVPDKYLFGHLTPRWLLRELKVLEEYSGGKGSLKGLSIVIGHMKPTLNKNNDPEKIIRSQLEAGNDMGINFIFPLQGERYKF
ncbi:3',5'-cyclic-nucleotide phosphodiesterase [Salmonella enterica]